MLPDRMINDIKNRISLHFGTEDPGLMKSAVRLYDAGFDPEDIREILSGAYRAGYKEAENDSQNW